MAYLGNSPVLSQQEYRNIDNISASFNGVTTSFPLLVNGVAPVVEDPVVDSNAALCLRDRSCLALLDLSMYDAPQI